MDRFENTCRTNRKIQEAIFKNGNSGDKKEYIMIKRPTLGMYTKDYTYTINIVDSVDKTIDNGLCGFKFTGKYNGNGNAPSKDKRYTETTTSVENTKQFFAFLNKHFSEKKLLKSQSEPLLPTKSPIKNAWTDPNEAQIPASVQNPSQSIVLEKVAALRAERERARKAAEEADRLAAETAALVAEKERAIKAAVEAERERARKAAEEADRLAAETAALVAVKKERAIKAEAAAKKAEAADKAAAAVEAERKRKYVSKFMTLLDDATKANKIETIEIMKNFNTSNPNILNIAKKTIPVKELSTQNSNYMNL